MFERFPQSDIDIVSFDGTKRHRTKAIMGAESITLPEASVTVLVGDEIRRLLPSGIEEVFDVVDPVYVDRFKRIPAHYQVKIRRKGAYPIGTGGNYHINVSGDNARINVSSADWSNNNYGSEELFVKINRSLNKIADPKDRSKIQNALAEIEQNVGDKDKLLSAYRNFISTAADHITILAPFIPALSQLLS